MALTAPPGPTGATFTARRLTAPWTLSPSTTNPDTVREWLTWTSVGVEGVVFKRLADPCRSAARGWRKYKVRETTEAIVCAITGSPRAAAQQTRQPGAPAVHRPHHHPPPHRRRRTRRAPRGGTDRASVDGLVVPARWGSRETLDVTLVEWPRRGSRDGVETERW
ncbi:hypothetical protein OHB41_00695 [Streptomyces sp. NBC_01571]|uniref:hypothetical protein n=1 Tax=Streptomyces sp. NBC_01571 TaxID=2975883 RepID=UPI00225976B2|nr:hypothetical protein [Streptomyces sp. NBC_01571]MCX4571751.1 hypothetical protein [Streptomyces sp. NBC_01571]